jgi:hypothetical protein
MSSSKDEPTPPPVPWVGQLAWLLFMQPMKLHTMLKAWGLDKDLSLWSLRRRLWDGDQTIRTLTLRLLLILVALGLTVAIELLVVLLMGWPIDWPHAAMGACMAIITGAVLFITIGAATGVVWGATLGITSPVMMGVILDLGIGPAMGVSVGISWSITVALQQHRALSSGLAFAIIIASCLLPSITMGVYFGTKMADVAFAVIFCLVSAIAYLLTLVIFHFRIPIFLAETVFTRFLLAIANFSERPIWIARWLPYRRHDLSPFPLWGLHRLLTIIGEHDITLGMQLIEEAAGTKAQHTRALRAFDDFLAIALERAVVDQNTWLKPTETNLDRLIEVLETLDPKHPFRVFVDTARDIQSARIGGSQHRRCNRLESARRRIESLKSAYTSLLSPGHRATRFHATASRWADAIEAERQALQHEIDRSPEVPAVFVIGSPLDPTNPDEVALFRVRTDLVGVIDHELDDDRRGPLLLTGQRRMGKTSLLRMLPPHLGTTTIATLDFQHLSGSGFGSAPHRWVVQALAKALANRSDLTLPSTDPVTDAWGTALDWLTEVDQNLAHTDHRVLIAIDEVERLQAGVEEGWSTITFLDFIRAAGDSLRRIRLLLVSAHPLSSPRLGPKWADRLISAIPRHLGPLPLDDAELLLRKPIPEFPDEMFSDDTAVPAILAQTGGHPYLIQVVGHELVKRLNNERRTTATPRDVERALDGALSLAQGVFSDLWQDFDEVDRTLLRALARGEPVDPNIPVAQSLRDQSFLELDDNGTPAFVFPLFGRWIRSYQA